MKRPRPWAFIESEHPSTRMRRCAQVVSTFPSSSVACRTVAQRHTWRTHPFFDALPEDALILIVRRLSTMSVCSPRDCPLLNLAPVSDWLRQVIADSVGSSLAFSVYGNPHWFWQWMAVAGTSIRHLSFHNRSYRAIGGVHHPWPSGPTRLGMKLDPLITLRSVHQVFAPLVELDISGFVMIRRSCMAQVEQLLTGVRPSLKKLRVDFLHFRVANAIVNARLTLLTTLAVAQLCHEREDDLLSMFRSMESEKGQGCSLTDLMLDSCINIPAIFRTHGTEVARLLPNLQVFHIDYDNELHYFTFFSNDYTCNLSAIATLPKLKSIRLAGSGMLVTQELITEFRTRCTNLTDLRLIDCDVAPDFRPDVYNPGRVCNQALTCTGNLLTHYYPRWVTFRLEQLDTLVEHCKHISHLRVFTAPGAESALSELGSTLRHSLVDLEVYPKIHEGKREMASTVVKMVLSLTKLERLRLITLDLSGPQLISILEHCGDKLKSFFFSPPLMLDKSADEKAQCVLDILVAAASQNIGLKRFECVFQDYAIPIVRSTLVAKKLKAAVRLLGRRATGLQSGNITDLVDKMTSVNRPKQSRNSWSY